MSAGRTSGLPGAGLPGLPPDPHLAVHPPSVTKKASCVSGWKCGLTAVQGCKVIALTCEQTNKKNVLGRATQNSAGRE